ncbi:hypothetical protein WN982_34180 [Paraburkholderia sp. IMGN_8]|uniref:hypothetical protein n=1 Tax=Paraburkholderia sp. IMGN_8 TaxID=3136564 RepID=UPI003101A0D3
MKAGWRGDDHRIDIRIRDDCFGLRQRNGAIESFCKPLGCAERGVGNRRELRIVESTGNALAVK